MCVCVCVCVCVCGVCGVCVCVCCFLQANPALPFSSVLFVGPNCNIEYQDQRVVSFLCINTYVHRDDVF